jgi:hypothetical protein
MTGASRIPAARVGRVLEERGASVVDVRRFTIHGVGHVDITLRGDDGRTEVARLGAESVPDGLEAGERVVARLVMGTVVAIERPRMG